MSGVLANGNPWMRDIPFTCENEPSDLSCVGGDDDARISEAVQFQTFIAGANPVNIGGTDYTILYGGVQWGYTYTSQDTPEPGYSVLVGLLLTGIPLANRYRRTRKKAG
jgi:hypothetical protein